jgi:sulfur transfer protein SufE
MMTIKNIQEEIVEEFSMFDDWMQRYEYIIMIDLEKLTFNTRNSKRKQFDQRLSIKSMAAR